jgi:hypothetical protein
LVWEFAIAKASTVGEAQGSQESALAYDRSLTGTISERVSAKKSSQGPQ